MKRKAKLSSHTAKTMQLRAPVTINATDESEDGPKGPPTFSSLAYSGGPVPGYTASPQLPHPYVIDLSGTTKARSPKANLDHKTHQRVGHVTGVENDGKQLIVQGALSAATQFRDEVANSAKDGFDWEVSIEGDLSGLKKLDKGKKAIVNGQTLEGPAYIVSSTRLTGIAFVSNGADQGNSVSIAASTAGEKTMNEFEKFVVSCGADPDTISDEHRANLQAAFDATHKAETTAVKKSSFAEAAEEIRRDQERQDAVEKMALESMREYPVYRDQIRKLADAAIESKTSPKDFELELLRGTRMGTMGFSSTINTQRAEMDPETIEAAICLSAGLPNIEKHFSERTLNTVDRIGMRQFSLQQLLMRVASANGYQCRAGDRVHSGNLRTILEYCFPPVTARMSGFSTISLPGILGSVANKELLAGYMEEDQTWREIADVKNVNNFHAVTSYRMLDDLEYEEVGPAGQIKHGSLGEESYTRQAKTYAKMLGLTRTDIINDDLGAFDDLRTRLGRGAAKKFNNIFWRAFMDNGSFFTANRTNYIEGSTSNLGIDGVGLQEGITAYRSMTTPAADGSKRIGVSAGRPTKVLVPPQLEFIARRHYQSTNLVGGSTTVPEANIHAGLYRPVVQDRLSDSDFTGNSATAWYLFGDNLNPMVVSFLNGQQSPTVESSDADFDTLGILFRGFHDFGADKSEYLAGIKSKGAA